MAYQQQQLEWMPNASRGHDSKSNQRIESRRLHYYQLFLHEPHVFPEKDDDHVSPMQKQNSSEEGQEEEEEGCAEEEDGESEERDQRDVTEVEDEPQQTLDTHELQLWCNQLQDDVEVLAAHLETQTQERTVMSILQNQLQQANMEMARDLQSLRIENDALRRQNAVLQQQRDEFEQKALFATEIHDELLLALNKHQQIEEQLQNSNGHLTRERAQARISLETAQNHCRRLEEELAATQTQLIQLQDERKAL